jgi:hypothetical protein
MVSARRSHLRCGRKSARRFAQLRGELQQEREARGRVEGQLDAINYAMRDPQSQTGHAWESRPQQPQMRPDPTTDIFAAQEFDNQRLARLERLEQEILAGQREQAEVDAYRNSMDRRSAQDKEFGPAYENWIKLRARELCARYYPQSTDEQINHAVSTGQIPQNVAQALHAEERSIYKHAFANGQDPSALVERLMVSRGYQDNSTRAAIAAEQRQEQARRAAEQRRAEQAEEEWFNRVARCKATMLGMSDEDALREILPRRDDRMRFRDMRARRQEQSWPGSTTATQRGAW